MVGNRQTQKCFFQIYGFSRVICGFFKLWETDKFKICFFQVEKFVEIAFHILKNASECQMGDIFAIKTFCFWGPKAENVTPDL